MEILDEGKLCTLPIVGLINYSKIIKIIKKNLNLIFN